MSMHQLIVVYQVSLTRDPAWIPVANGRGSWHHLASTYESNWSFKSKVQEVSISRGVVIFHEFFDHRHWLLTWWVDSDKTCHCRSMQGAKNLAASPLTMRLVRVKVATPEGRQGTWLHAWLHGPPLPIGESSDFFGSFWKKVTLMGLVLWSTGLEMETETENIGKRHGFGWKGGGEKDLCFFFVPWNLGHFMLCHWGGPLYLYVYSFTSKTTSAPKKTLEDDSVFERSMNNFFLAFGAAGRRVVYNTNACLRKWGRDFTLQTTQRKIRQKHLSSSSRPSVLPCCPRKRWGAKWGLNGYVPVV